MMGGASLISRNVTLLNVNVHDVINYFYFGKTIYQTKHKQVSFLLVRHSKSLVLKKFEIKGCG